jgi:hypothetical protein
MVKLKVDLTDQDPNESLGGNFEQPKPGIYSAKVKECTPRFEDEDEKKVRDLEVVFEITDKRYKGSRIWDYVGFSEAAKWKLDQFMLAIGKASTKKRKFTFDPDDAVGTPVTVRVRAGSYNGEYRAKVAQILALDEDAAEDEDVLDDEELEEEEEDELEEEEDDDEDWDEEEDEEAEDEEAEEWDEDSLNELSLAELKKVASEHGVEVKKGKRKNTYVDEILATYDEEEDEEAEDDWTREDIEALDNDELKELMEEWGVKRVKNKRKPYYIDKLVEAMGLEDEDDDDAPF